MTKTLLQQLYNIQHSGSDHDITAHLVMGAHKELGFEAAATLAEQGKPVIVASNHLEKITETQAHLRFQTGNKEIYALHLDYCDLNSVQKAVNVIIDNNIKLETVVNAIDFASFDREITADQLEKAIAINHFGPFYLIHQLNQQFIDQKTHLILFNSPAHRYGYIDPKHFATQKHFSPFNAYANAKLANAITIVELASQLDSRGIRINGFSPITSDSIGPLSINLLAHAQYYLRRYRINHTHSISALNALLNKQLFPTTTGRLFINHKVVDFGKRAFNNTASALALHHSTRFLMQLKNKLPPAPTSQLILPAKGCVNFNQPVLFESQ